MKQTTLIEEKPLGDKIGKYIMIGIVVMVVYCFFMQVLETKVQAADLFASQLNSFDTDYKEIQANLCKKEVEGSTLKLKANAEDPKKYPLTPEKMVELAGKRNRDCLNLQ